MDTDKGRLALLQEIPIIANVTSCIILIYSSVHQEELAHYLCNEIIFVIQSGWRTKQGIRKNVQKRGLYMTLVA
jgi:hypothetical protein